MSDISRPQSLNQRTVAPLTLSCVDYTIVSHPEVFPIINSRFPLFLLSIPTRLDILVLMHGRNSVTGRAAEATLSFLTRTTLFITWLARISRVPHSTSYAVTMTT